MLFLSKTCILSTEQPHLLPVGWVHTAASGQQSVASFMASVSSKYHPGQLAVAIDRRDDITEGTKLERVQIPHPVFLDMFKSQSP